MRRKVLAMITIAHNRMTAKRYTSAIETFEQAETACMDLLGFKEEMIGEIHHSLAYCYEQIGDRTRCKVSKC